MARIATGRFAGAVGCGAGALSALTLAAIAVSRFGPRHLPTPSGVAFFTVFSGVSGAIVGLLWGGLMWFGLRVVRRLARRTLLVGSLALVLLWLLAMLRMDAVQVLLSPGYGGVMVLSLLGCVASVGRHRELRRGDVASLICVGPALLLLGLWLNFGFIRKSDEVVATQLNLGLLLGAYAVATLGAWSSGRGGEVRGTLPARRTRLALPALVALLAASLLPLHYGVRQSFRPASAAPIVGQAPTRWTDVPDPLSRGIRPSFVLISIDTLRADHVGSYGYSLPTTPNLDRFFATGSVFERSYSTSGWTLPSHASILTGQLPSTHSAELSPIQTRGRIDPIASETRTIAELLRQDGYRTAGFTGGSFVGDRWGMNRGFETFVETQSTRMPEALDLALPWLDEAGGEPFLLFLHAYDVHRYDPPQSFAELPAPNYDGPLLTLRKRGPRVVESYCVADAFYSLDATDVSYLEWLYDSELHGVDAELQRLFRALEEGGRLRDTVVILTSDHGEEFGEHGATGHSFNLYDSLLRVPLMIRIPGAPANRLGALTSGVDIAPTMLQLAGLSPTLSASMQGRSLLPAIFGMEAGSSAAMAVAEADVLASRRALVRGRYKLIDNDRLAVDPFDPRNALLLLRTLFAGYRTGQELYELEQDPGEHHDRSADEPLLVKRLTKQLGNAGRRLKLDWDTVDRTQQPKTLDPVTRERLRALGYVQ